MTSARGSGVSGVGVDWFTVVVSPYFLADSSKFAAMARADRSLMLETTVNWGRGALRVACDERSVDVARVHRLGCIWLARGLLHVE